MTSFDKVIPPGGVGKVTASLDTTHLTGPITKAVSVFIGSPERIAAVLQLKARVEPVVAVQPAEIPNLRMAGGEAKPAEFTVSSTEGRRFDVLTVQADPFLTAAVRPAGHGAAGRTPGHGRVAKGRSSWVVTVTPKPNAPVGEAVRSVTLGTNLSGAETIPIRVVLLVGARVRVVPERLTVKPAAEPPVLHVRIDKPGSTGFRILGVGSSDADFHVTVSPIREGREYDVAVRYAGRPARGTVRARITARTNQPDAPTIVIPLEGRI